MGNLISFKQDEISPMIKAKSLFSNGDVEQAFIVLKEASENGDIMACYDCGFMMVQGIGCEKDVKGFQLMYKGMKLEEQSKDINWKSDGSITELFEPQTLNLHCRF